MPSVIDAFILEFGLDPAKFTAGQKAVIEGMQKTEEEALRAAKEIEEHGKRAAEFFRELRTQVIELYAAFTAGRGLKEFVEDITHSDSQLGYLAKRLDMSVNELARWQGAMASVGGSAEDVTSTFSALTHDFQSLLITGNSQFLPYFRALGVQISDANGKMRSQTDIMNDLNRVFSKMDPARAAAFGAAMGISPKMMDLLIKAPDEYHKILTEQEKLRYETEADAKAAQAREAAWDNFIVTATNLGRVILTAVTPALLSLTKVLTNIAIWFNAHPIAIKAAFTAITAVVGLLTLAISEKLIAGALGRLLTTFASVRIAGLAAFTPTGSVVGLLTKGALALLPILGVLSTDAVPGLGNSLLELGIVGPSAFTLISSAVGLISKGLIALMLRLAVLTSTVLPGLSSAFLAVGAAIEATPLGWIVTALAAVGAAAFLLYRNWDWVWSHMMDVVKAFIPVYNNVVAPILGLPKIVEKKVTPPPPVTKPATETSTTHIAPLTGTPTPIPSPVTPTIPPAPTTTPAAPVATPPPPTGTAPVSRATPTPRPVPERVTTITPPTVAVAGPTSSPREVESTIVHEIRATGNAEMLPYFRSLGISLTDNAGHVRNLSAVMEDLNRTLSSMSPQKAQAYGTAMGLSIATTELLMKPPAEYREIVAEHKELAIPVPRTPAVAPTAPVAGVAPTAPVAEVAKPTPTTTPTPYAGFVGGERVEATARKTRESDIQAFVKMGWTRDQAIGIVANEMRESGGNERAVGDQGTAFGLAQWHPDRQADFARWAGHDIRQSTREEQLAFINYELREGSKKKAGEALAKTTTAPEAAKIVSTRYEIPANAAGEAATRAQIAAAISNLPTSLLTTAKAGTSAGVANDNRVSHYNSDTKVGQIIVNTQATDAEGIGKDLKPILQRQSFAAAADTGPN